MTALTIIIPTYNRPALLQRTLQTLASQSDKRFQVILVDHGSTEDIKAIFDRYKEKIAGEYYWIPRSDAFAPAIPRDYGVKKAQTPFIAFLDTGTLVPSYYVAAHLAFHRNFPRHVGLGLQHSAQESAAQEDLSNFLNQTDTIDNVEEIIANNKTWCDFRRDRKLEDLLFTWTWGWSSNLSLPTEAYQEAGGFDLDLKGWGFEDVDLCYRLHKHGLAFALVDHGWSVEMPHSRIVAEARWKTHRANICRCYAKQRSLALESLLYAVMPTKAAEETFMYLTALGESFSSLPALSAETVQQFARPSLLIGGTTQNAPHFDYIALANEQITTTSSLWSCSGVVIPLPDDSLETVVVSEIWKKLNWSHSIPTPLPARSLLACLVADIKRTAKKACFIDTSSIDLLAGQKDASVTDLANLCEQYNLLFQLISGDNL